MNTPESTVKQSHRATHRLGLLDYCTGYLSIVTHWLLRLLPIDVCSWLGCVLGKIIGPRHREADERLRTNIRHLRPDLKTPQEIDAMAAKTWGNIGRIMAEFSVLRRIWRSDRTKLEGLDNITAAQESGRPIIVLFLHLGNWEVVGPKLYDLSGGRGLQIYQVLDNPFQLRIAKNIRRPYEQALITNGPAIGKTIYNRLNEGYHLSIAVDECVRGKVNTPSFGRPLRLTGNLTFAVRMAKLTNAVLCPVYAVRTKGARFEVRVLPPVVFDFSDFDKKKLREAVTQLDQIIDPIIRRYFEQWYYGIEMDLSE